MVSDHQIFVVGALTTAEAPQAGGEFSLSLKISVSINTPHNSLNHSKKKLPKSN